MLYFYSFDIGINFLCYSSGCFDTTQKTLKGSITLFDIQLINLTDLNADNIIRICTSIVKTGKNKGKRCSRRCCPGFDMCKIHSKMHHEIYSANIENMNTRCPQKKKKYNKSEIFHILISKLNEIDVESANLILIEIQYDKNVKMIELSHYIYAYFMIKKLERNLDELQVMYNTPRGRVYGMCKIFAGRCEFIKNNRIKNNRKKNAIILAKHLLENYILYTKGDRDCANHSTTEEKYDIDIYVKKDDIADTIVQVVYYLIREYKLKIQL